MKIEVCAGNIEDVKIANMFKIDRIELNSGLSTGGLTPSLGLVKTSISLSKIPIVTMIRLREGSFTYTDTEISVMYEDAKTFLKLGVSGIVFGFLNKDNSLDIPNITKFISLAKSYGKEAIFHRAIDVSDKYIENIHKLIDLGIDRILTSGSKNTVMESIEILESIKDLPIIIGSGINKENIHIFKDFKEVHGSFSRKILNKYSIDFGSYTITDEEVLSILGGYDA